MPKTGAYQLFHVLFAMATVATRSSAGVAFGWAGRRPGTQSAGRVEKEGTGRCQHAGRVTRAQLREIAEAKMKDLNANDIEAAARIIEGSARAMGLEVTGS